MKTITALLFILAPVFSFAALPVTHVSNTVVQIGTAVPKSANPNQINIEALAAAEKEFATGAATTISTVVAEKEATGYILLAAIPTSYSTPLTAVNTLPVKSGMITSVILVFTKLPPKLSD